MTIALIAIICGVIFFASRERAGHDIFANGRVEPNTLA